MLSNIRTPDTSIRYICDSTGLSEKAVISLMETHKNDDNENSFSISNWWSNILSDDSFFEIPLVWGKYARIVLELKKLDEEIKNSIKAAKEVPIEDPIMEMLLSDNDCKSLKIIQRDKEDMKQGAHYNMLVSITKYMDKYAEEWAKAQCIELGEMYYHNEMNKRKIFNSKFQNNKNID